MIIKKIYIQNFRSYYKENSFDLSDGLNLIIGSNGDGKTTFYEALEWLFKTDDTKKMDTKYISKKRVDELFANDSDDVRVAMTYEHNGTTKTLEKMFHFTKSFDDDISTSNYTFTLTIENGIERINNDGTLFDRDISPELRKYIMFKGESDLDILENSNSLKILIENFSEVKDFDAYFGFMNYAVGNANKALEHIQTLDRKNAKKIKELNSTIDAERRILGDIDTEIKLKSKEVDSYEGLLKNIEQSKESSTLLKAVNKRIETFQNKRIEKISHIKEDYTKYLLDEMWILLGFGKIAEEYSSKVSNFDIERRAQEKSYLLEVGAKSIIKKVQKEDFTPLPVHIPGQKIMEEMLNDEVCKICGRPAKKHTEAWEYMRQRLEEYKESIKSADEEDIEPYYKNSFIVELQKRDTILNDNLSEVTRKRKVIQDAIALNNRLHEDVKNIDANIDMESEQKNRILAQADGLSEEQLLANYENISEWVDKRVQASRRIEILNSNKLSHTAALEEAEKKRSQISEGTEAGIYARTALVMQHILNAFKNARDENKRRLLCSIEDKSNMFMEKLNTNDFKGTIRINERQSGQGEVFLVNNDTVKIFNPNTALKTTYLMSVLFGISELSTEKEKTRLPLIFDAPTSSFTDAKENEFFNVISTLNKQVIIVTKSFLNDGTNGEVVLDSNRVNSINGRVFRIEKKRPFDDKNLGTIQTVITRIK